MFGFKCQRLKIRGETEVADEKNHEKNNTNIARHQKVTAIPNRPDP